jgi:hypothetical protein
MHIKKRIINWELVRRVSRPFGWVDARLIREDWLGNCSPTAWALYLFWVTVADAQGLSYYSDESMARRLRITSDALSAGRAELIQAGLLAHEPPLVQVLSLERRMTGTSLQRSPVCRAGLGNPEGAVLIGDMLRSWTQGGAQ